MKLQTGSTNSNRICGGAGQVVLSCLETNLMLRVASDSKRRRRKPLQHNGLSATPIFPPRSVVLPVSYTHLTLPTNREV